ncbi:MAG: SRPBCC family protein [Gaiellaceae bacterium]
MTIDESIEIEKPPEVVWSLVRDLERAPEWQQSLESVNVQAGTEVRRFAGRTQEATFLIVEDDAPRRLAITSEGGPASARATLELSPSGDGTRVAFTLDIELHGAARLAGGIVRAAAQRAAQANLRRLKEVAEA